ncbi:hypothetical protein AYO44_09690 [Planctomycetaceae bacterium SCGC AG-212-F19]|nr:hypothetical protein AYO44_09690 [Planctomycetaceae bacterium SCGC AG-212-F19]
MNIELTAIDRLPRDGESRLPPHEDETPLPDLPQTEIPQVPDATVLWSRFLTFGIVLVALFLLNQVTFVLFDYWLLQSLSFENVFWTNFNMGAWLYAIACVAYTAAVAIPAYVHDVGPRARRLAVLASLIIGPMAGYLLCTHYLDFLLLFHGKSFGKVDNVFGLDYGFYVFRLHALWDIWQTVLGCSIFFVLSAVICAFVARRHIQQPQEMSRVSAVFGLLATNCSLLAISLLGMVIAFGLWFTRYNLLSRDNSKKIDETFYSTGVFQGPTYVDVTGWLTTLNGYWVTAFIALFMTLAFTALLQKLALAVERRPNGANWQRVVARYGWALLILLTLDFGYLAAVGIRQLIFVTPNQPVVQLPFIKQHIDATRDGYNLDAVEEVSFVPKDGLDTLPTVAELLQSPTMKNAPLWPGFVSRLEPQLDPQHAKRVVQTNGDIIVYGPTLEVLRAQQKLRPYYNFLDIDTVRYSINGEKRMFVSAVREVPLVEPAPWLAWWGQQFMLFTHGHGLVMAPTNEIDTDGWPVYWSYDIPPETRADELKVNNNAIYYGEGSGTMAYSNVRNMKELDYPTEEGRAENKMPPGDAASVPIDSFLKRLVFGWRSGQFWEIVFSDLIGPETHVHYYRTPIERIERIAPMLFFDTDPFAFIADGKILWMVNAMTTTDLYPYSRRETLGDMSDDRSQAYIVRPHRRINYVRDTVKATVDAYSGRVTLYKIASCPIIESWENIYPGLFTSASQMPKEVRAQLQYPHQLMHIQFDDMYIYYHMKDPMTFFNMEDMWDDGDEVLGSMGINTQMFHSGLSSAGKSITFSIEPYNWMVDTSTMLPQHKDKVQAKDKIQFALSMVFTPEKALNLRAIPTVYQDGDDYGRMVCLTVPKGYYFLGPEQADAAADQDPIISQQFQWWQRQGSDVVRGHTTTLLINGEVIYIEPVFIRSQQHAITQIKKVIAVVRGKARMGETLEEALTLALEAAAKDQDRRRSDPDYAKKEKRRLGQEIPEGKPGRDTNKKKEDK